MLARPRVKHCASCDTRGPKVPLSRTSRGSTQNVEAEDGRCAGRTRAGLGWAPRNGHIDIVHAQRGPFRNQTHTPKYLGIRDKDSTTVGVLTFGAEGIYRFKGSDHWAVPDGQFDDWRKASSVALVPAEQPESGSTG